MTNLNDDLTKDLDKVVVAAGSNTWVNDFVQESDTAVRISDPEVIETDHEEDFVKDVVIEEHDETNEPAIALEEEAEVVEEERLSDGTVREVLDRVGTDKDLATRALTEENAKETPRTTLVRELQEIIEA